MADLDAIGGNDDRPIGENPDQGAAEGENTGVRRGQGKAGLFAAVEMAERLFGAGDHVAEIDIERPQFPEHGPAAIQQIALPELDRIESQLIGDLVHLGLRGPDRLWSADRPEGGSRHSVRVGAHRLDLEIFDGVGSDGAVRRLDRHRRTGIGIGPAIHQDPAFLREDAAGRVDRGSERDRRAETPAGQHGFVEREQDANRTPGLPRRRGDQRLQFNRGLAPEAAPHIGHDHANIAEVEPEDPRQDLLDRRRRLGARPDRQFVVLESGDHAVRFEGEVGNAGETVSMLENARGPLFGFLHIALLDDVLLKDVGAGDRIGLPREIEICDTFEVLMEDRRIRADRRRRRVDNRQCLVIDVDQVEGVLRDFGRFGDHDRDRFADIAHLVARNHRSVVEIEPPGGFCHDLRQVGPGQDGDDTVERQGGRCVDPGDAGMGQRTAQDSPMGHAVNRDIADIDGPARDFLQQIGPERLIVVARHCPHSGSRGRNPMCKRRDCAG